MSAVTFNRTDLEWLGRLPATKAEGQARGFDGRAWLAGYLKASARDKAEEVYLGLDEFMAAAPRTLEDLDEHVTARGMVLLEAWGSTMLLAGADGEPWAKEAANQAALVYRDRMAELMDTASMGGRA